MSSRISIVIPCLNEESTIAGAVSEALDALRSYHFDGEILVVDNGSTDRSRESAVAAGARVIAQPIRGYGAALRAGIMAAENEVIIIADADRSYCFFEIDRLLRPLISNDADFVLGSRYRGTIETGAMPFLNQYIGTPLLTFFIRFLFLFQVSDCNSGFRAFRRSQVSCLNLKTTGMEFASELLIRVRRSKLRYIEVPITYRKDSRNRRPHLRRWRDGIRHLSVIFGTRLFGG